MVKGWSAPIRAFAHTRLVELWKQLETPIWLQWGWFCPKPKDPTVEFTLDGLRPLILLEVLQKLWAGMVISRITRAWECHRSDITPLPTRNMVSGPGDGRTPRCYNS